MPTIDWKKSLRLFATGFTMGAADIVPGVSGGTVAFLLGIYEELIYSIKLVSGEVLKLFLQGKIKQGWALIPFSFLIPLALGLASALVTLSGLITFLLTEYPSYLWSFFFGLVLASVWSVRKKVVTWNPHDIAAGLITAVGTYFLVGAVPVETPNNALMMFASGAIAICAMILPGISGSFLLVIMGKYEQVLGSLVNGDFITLGIFTAGTIVGLAVFSRVLSYLFSKHHDIIIAILIGFMLGSLRKIWPWKEVLTTRINSHGEVVPLLEKNILPATLDASVMLCIGLAVLGLITILVLDRFQLTKEHTADIEDPSFNAKYKQSLKSQKQNKI